MPSALKHLAASSIEMRRPRSRLGINDRPFAKLRCRSDERAIVPSPGSAARSTQLRHPHATELINEGVSLATIQRRLVHKNLQMRRAPRSSRTRRPARSCGRGAGNEAGLAEPLAGLQSAWRSALLQGSSGPKACPERPRDRARFQEEQTHQNPDDGQSQGCGSGTLEGETGLV
jgi:hypothetical protein